MRASGAAEFLREPVGSYIVGRSFMVWARSPRLIGAVHRSPLDLSDRELATALAPLPIHASLEPPFDVIHDLSDVRTVDHSVFEYAHGFLVQWVEELAKRTRRIAVVCPQGLAGAAFTGMFTDWIQARFEAILCSERDEAYDWLGLTDTTDIDAICDAFLQPELLRRLREALAADPDATIERTAPVLGISVRSLQRHLAQHRTSFTDELARVKR